MKLNLKNIVIFSHDFFITILSFSLAVFIRLGDDILFAGEEIIASIMLGSILSIIFQYIFTIHRVILRYFSLPDAIKVLKYTNYYCLILWIGLFIFLRLENIPRSVLLIHYILLNTLLISPRVAWRIIREYQVQLGIIGDYRKKIQVLVMGVTPQSENFIRSTNRNKKSEYIVIGIIDDKDSRKGRFIHNVPIIGKIEELPVLLPKLKLNGELPQKIVISQNFPINELNYYLEYAGKLGLTIAKIPSVNEIDNTNDGEQKVNPIVLEDLLGRPQVIAATQEIQETLSNKVIMITGGGGTIGGEILRQIISYNPAKIIIIDSSEYNLYATNEEFKSYGNLIVYKIGDVRSLGLIDAHISKYKPNIIFHAAALKHVPIAELNTIEALTTNFLGTKNICDLSLKHNLEAIILISTDKAVNPSNVMGATKRMAEYYMNYCNNLGTATKFITVRFGNVLGSSGSVIPLFAKQIQEGGPITITHPEITRFFMTIKEAVTLVLNAVSLGIAEKEYSNGIFILNMGNAVKIYDLASRMIRLTGLKPEKDIKITYTGLRPGEKLFEELVYSHEEQIDTKHQDLMFSKFNCHNIINEEFLKQLVQVISECNELQVPIILKKYLTEFKA
ncbi:polysaccharide biosynthesis protein [Rickettsiales endosymbiont of Stachyamoeba lipophora]|uniref:polysaccharide biosynthesis protein n=1 Tax=Rickettsiales endosymbiont of Stachyamoeba lipophora TaxID=2486578 RepID=UPI000F64BE8D|nr:polysaccharide biosynthesis protein [Rickettsiales endosymbiont of Stachyamoeba lipophora]AZL15530.1 polysaccharide biosynthesis protein [Rickettsiales endosymbiont of Stachyamoeba lipophora]